LLSRSKGKEGVDKPRSQKAPARAKKKVSESTILGNWNKEKGRNEFPKGGRRRKWGGGGGRGSREKEERK